MLVAGLTASLGIAINLATDLKHNMVAWGCVFALTVAIALVTAVGERNRLAPKASPSSTTTSTPEAVSAPVASELVMRRTEHISPSGRKTITTDFYSKEIAMQSLGDDSFDEGSDE
jgi:hypothetical protein